VTDCNEKLAQMWRLARNQVVGPHDDLVQTMSRHVHFPAAYRARIAEIHATFPDLELLAGGGVRDADDLRALAAAGAAGALVATALHRGTIGVG